MTTTHDVNKELEQIQVQTRRWLTRLVRVTNMLTKLDGKRRRLAVKLNGRVPVKAPAKPQVSDVTEISWSEMTGADLRKHLAETDALDVPAELKRVPPDTAWIKQKVSDAERKKMPLAGKAAQEAIRAASDAVTARRRKRRLEG